MDFFTAMDVLASGLGAERVRLNATASNIANAQTTRTTEGGPYKRRDPVFETQPLDTKAFGSALRDAVQLVSVTEIAADLRAPRQVYDPGHPDANAQGIVSMPNVNVVEEMVNMLTAARAYEAGNTAMQAVVEMAQKTLSIGR